MIARFTYTICCIGTMLFIPAAVAQDGLFVIDLSAKSTFDTVFESGLRPKRVRGFESSIVDAKNVELRLLFSEDAIFDFDAAKVEFHIMKDDLLGGISMTSDRLTVEQAEESIRPLAIALGANEVELKSFFDSVSRNPIAFRSDQFAVNRDFNHEIKIGLGFRNTFSKNQPLVAEFGVTWSKRFGRNLFLRNPITPPQGWEHLSLEPDTPAVASVDETMPSIDKADLLPRTDSNDPNEQLEGGESDDSALSPRWAYAIAGIALLLIVLGFYAYRKRHR